VAQVFSRGTLTRSRWDFFESSDAFANVIGPVGATSGGQPYLYNNGGGPGELDIYYACVSFASATNFTWALVGPSAQFGIGLAQLQTVHAVKADGPMPLGVAQIAVPNGNNQKIVIAGRIDPVTFYELKFGLEGPFLSLPPGYALQVIMANPDLQASATFLYQSVVDITAPAV
jgi:hypothetical protein